MKAPYFLDRFGACSQYLSACAKLQAVASVAQFALGNLHALAADNRNGKSPLAAFFTGATLSSIFSKSKLAKGHL